MTFGTVFFLISITIRYIDPAGGKQVLGLRLPSQVGEGSLPVLLPVSLILAAVQVHILRRFSAIRRSFTFMLLHGLKIFVVNKHFHIVIRVLIAVLSDVKGLLVGAASP